MKIETVTQRWMPCSLLRDGDLDCWDLMSSLFGERATEFSFV